MSFLYRIQLLAGGALLLGALLLPGGCTRFYDLDAGDGTDGPSCTDQCDSLYQRRCLPDKSGYEECIQGGSGCLVWDDSVVCPEPDACTGAWECGKAEGSDRIECLQTDEGLDCTAPGACDDDDAQCPPCSCVLDGEAAAGAVCVREEACTAQTCDDGDVCTQVDTCLPSDCACEGNPSPELPKGVPGIAEGLCGCPNGQVDCDVLTATLQDAGLWDLCDGSYTCKDVTGKGKTCVRGAPVDCSGEESECVKLACDPASGDCTIETPIHEGEACVATCAESATCQSGECVADQPKQCEPDGCDQRACNPDTGDCEPTGESEPCCCGTGLCDCAAKQCDDGQANGSGLCSDQCTVVGCYSQALELDGSGCLVVPGAGILTDAATAFSIELYIKPAPGGAGEQVILDRELTGAAGEADWRLVWLPAPDNKLKWYEGRQGSGSDPFSTSAPLTPGAWTKVRMERTPGAPQGTIAWFLDDTAAGSGDLGVMDDLASSQNIYVGCAGGASAFFTGAIDELRITSDGGSDALALHFDETAPGISEDSAAGGHHAAWIGGVRSTMDSGLGDGVAGTCPSAWCARRSLGFAAGASPVGRVASADALDGEQALTVELFFRPGAADAGAILSRETGVAAERDWSLSFYNSKLIWSEGESDSWPQTNALSKTDGSTWYYVAVVRKLDPDPELRIYVEEKGSGEAVLDRKLSIPDQDLVSGGALYLGSADGASEFLTGAVDELRISAGARFTDQRIPVPASLDFDCETLGLYRFDDVSDVEASDAFNAIPAQPMGPMELSGVETLDIRASGLAGCP